jgi:putative ABC transport system permease protein
MSLLQTFRVAVRALLRNPTRSALTTLGIVIGVAAVIAMVAIGEGAKAKVTAAFASMGSNLLIVLPGSTTAGGVQGGFGTMPTLTWDDLKAIRSELTAVRAAAPVLRSTASVVAEEQNWTTSIHGTTADYFPLRSWPIALGSAFSDNDVDAGNKVVVLGRTVVDELFGPDADPVGRTVRIKNTPFVVVGVTAKKGQSPFGQDYDDAAFLPASTFSSKIQGGLRSQINGTVLVGSVSAEDTRRAEQQVAGLLRDRHRLAPDADDDFSIRNLTEMASAQAQGTQTLTALLMSVAAVSLLVGGIGIMNIMLVSVTERTREIGLRMAIGARPVDILLQFLVESLVLSLIGGLIGISLGLFAAAQLAARFDWPTLIRMDVIGGAVLFSGLVGVVFGLYPARKASLLDPIDALRYE